MSPLVDQRDRDRFLQETDQNFSVIAPAGVGKTTAIVGRIAQIGREDAGRISPLLPRLVVVTYTKKAAQELQDRARRKLLDDEACDEITLQNFGQATFGTIHSFCLDLLRRYGHHLGLAPGLELVESDDARQRLWDRFVRGEDTLSACVPEPLRTRFLQLAALGGMLELAREFTPSEPPTWPGVCPKPDMDALLEAEETGRSKATIARSKAAVRRWLEALENDQTRGLGFPELQTKAKDFVPLWEIAFHPIHAWLAEVGLGFVTSVAEKFRAYRLEQGKLTFDDMIALADQLLTLPAARAEIRACDYHVILDEAQDTDPAQFRVLTGVARAGNSGAPWPGSDQAPPGGRFCMVGDPQQSIYSDRADLTGYLTLHEALTTAPGGDALTFCVTMRCDEAVVSAVNTTFPSVLDGQRGQVHLVPLEARPAAGEGRVERLQLGISPESSKADDLRRAEAQALAEWIAAQRPADFGVSTWGEIALLAPRKTALDALTYALNRVGLPYQNHSRLDLRGDDPAFAWTSALLWVLTHPEDHFELFGVLREVYALGDGELSLHVREALDAQLPHPLQLESPPELPGEAGQVLQQLYRLRHAVANLPLREALDRVLADTSLRARLAVLPGYRPEHLEKSLEQLRLDAGLAELRGESLVDFAIHLRERHAEASEELARDPERLQLLSCHKSKGLEWPVVIVPFFHHNLGEPRQQYPLLHQAPGEPPLIQVCNAHDVGPVLTANQQRSRQSDARLLYVTATRARHSLVFVDASPTPKKTNEAFANQLGIGEDQANAPWWHGLPPFSAKITRFKPPAEPDADQDETNSHTEDAAPLDTARALSVASNFPRRLLPSGLAKHEAGGGHHRDERDLVAEPMFPEVAAAAAAKQGADYGNWWHLTMETLPWATPELWPEHTKARLNACPMPERGREELAQFFTSEVASVLANPAWCVRTEVPMFWPDGEERVYDGTIDLAACHEDGHWLVVDWKTDIIPPAGLPGLIDTYGPQLQCYQQALNALFGTLVEARLYSTRRGEWIAL